MQVAVSFRTSLVTSSYFHGAFTGQTLLVGIASVVVINILLEIDRAFFVSDGLIETGGTAGGKADEFGAFGSLEFFERCHE